MQERALDFECDVPCLATRSFDQDDDRGVGFDDVDRGLPRGDLQIVLLLVECLLEEAVELGLEAEKHQRTVAAAHHASRPVLTGLAGFSGFAPGVGWMSDLRTSMKASMSSNR